MTILKMTGWLLYKRQVLPESECKRTEYDKVQQPLHKGGKQGFLETNPLGFPQQSGISVNAEQTNLVIQIAKFSPC